MKFEIIVFEGEAKPLGITKAVGVGLAAPQHILREAAWCSTHVGKVQQLIVLHH